jgi:transposase
MIEPQKRLAAITLHQAGRGIREVARLLGIDVKSVKKIIQEGPEAPRKPRSDTLIVDEAVLRQVFQKASGYTPRIHEILKEEYGIQMGYSTLTLKLRSIGLGKKPSSRACMEPDIPGDEGQHDTSTYKVILAEHEVKVVCSCLYLRYSKVCYIKFYRSFDRFAMQCFFDEALRYWGYCPKQVVIDNTHLAVWYGTGAQAVFIPEMVSFAKRYGFFWLAHAVNHPNRKSGVESFFNHITSNFIAGRDFSSLEDMNQQAFDWVTDRYAKRPKAKTGLIPIQAFENEKAHLLKLPDYIPRPCRPHVRVLDQYGYCAFKANYYWVPEYAPGTKEKIHRVKIFEFAAHIVIYRILRMLELVRYPLPKDGVKNKRYAPDGVNLRYKPRHRKLNSRDEEKKLRAMGPDVNRYLDFIYSSQCKLAQKQHFICRLYRLSSKMAPQIFRKAVSRALLHHLYRIEAIAKIAGSFLRDTEKNTSFSQLAVDDSYTEREAYLKGRFCGEHELENPDLFDDPDEDKENSGEQ